jgi:hypothetical protein
MTAYAANTTVSSESSRNEIERILRRYGADDFAYATNRDRAMIGFVAEGRQVRFVLPLPDRQSREFTHHSRGVRTATAAEAAYEQAIRQRWRALALMVKAKLEAVQSGIVTFEQEFLPHIMLPNGQTVYSSIADGIESAYLSGKVAPLLQIGAGS